MKIWTYHGQITIPQYQCTHQVWWKWIDIYSSYHLETKIRTDWQTDNRWTYKQHSKCDTIIPPPLPHPLSCGGVWNMLADPPVLRKIIKMYFSPTRDELITFLCFIFLKFVVIVLCLCLSCSLQSWFFVKDWYWINFLLWLYEKQCPLPSSPPTPPPPSHVEGHNMDGISGWNIGFTFWGGAGGLYILIFFMKYRIFCDNKYNVHRAFMKTQEKLIFCKYTEFLCKMCVNNFYKCTKFFDLWKKQVAFALKKLLTFCHKKYQCTCI